MITLNPRDSRPIYEQIVENLRRLILSGALSQGERLPSVRQLAAQLTINPNTIQRAYAQLESEGWLVSYPGKGSFVAQSPQALAARKAELTAALQSVAAQLVQLGTGREELEQMIGGIFDAED